MGSTQKKKQPCAPPNARKRKTEQEVGSERRNPSRKARPRENFAVEEHSEPGARRGPRTIDVRRLVEVSPRREGATDVQSRHGVNEVQSNGRLLRSTLF